MKIAKYLLTALIGVMSAGAGVAKIMLIDQEIEFFALLGLPGSAVIAFGLAQLLAAILLLPDRTRLIGIALAGVLFFLSALMLIAIGSYPFGATSLVPVVVCAVLALSIQRNPNARQK